MEYFIEILLNVKNQQEMSIFLNVTQQQRNHCFQLE